MLDALDALVERARRVEFRERHLVDALRLSDVEVERFGRVDEPDEGRDRHREREGRDVGEAIEQADGGARDAELLLELPERRIARVAVALLEDPARERDLRGIAAEVRRATDEDERGLRPTNDGNHDGRFEHRALLRKGCDATPQTVARVRLRPYAFDVVAIGAAIVAIAIRPSPLWVERAYANGAYPHVDRAIRALTGPLPFCLGDVLFFVALVWLVRYPIVAVRRAARRDRVRAGARAGLRIVAALAFVFVWFLGSWGLGYDRIPLARKIVVHDERTDEDTVAAFADRLVDRLTRDAPAAHRVAFSRARVGDELVPTFETTIARFGDRATFAPPRVKPTVFQRMMEWTATAGFTDPWTHEINVDANATPYEFPAYYAHEWAHVSGFNDEAEANFISVLACTRSHDPLLVYSGWLLVWFNLPPGVKITHRMGRLAYDDIVSIRARVLRHLDVRAARVQRVAYDRYLKSNHVRAGYASYQYFIRWMTGAEFDPSGLPRVRADVDPGPAG